MIPMARMVRRRQCPLHLMKISKAFDNLRTLYPHSNPHFDRHHEIINALSSDRQAVTDRGAAPWSPPSAFLWPAPTLGCPWVPTPAVSGAALVSRARPSPFRYTEEF